MWRDIHNNNSNGEVKRMAIYHASVKIISRSKKHSSLAAAAYRAGILLVDHRTGLRHDYRRKRGIVETICVAPQDAPAWFDQPQQLWAAAEAAERRKDSAVAREFEVALPHELNTEQRSALVQDLARSLVDRYSFAVQASTHEPTRGGLNHHVHILATTRRIESTGLTDKTRELDGKKTGKEEVAWAREMIADTINDHLLRAGIDEQVDHRTLDAQAQAAWDRGDQEEALILLRQPRRTLSKNASALERKGVATAIQNENIKIELDNVARSKKYLEKLAQTGASEEEVRADLATSALEDFVVPDAEALSGRDDPKKELTAEVAWSRVQEIWNQHIRSKIAAPMDLTKRVMDDMAERVRVYLHDNALPGAMKELLRRLEVLKRRMEAPEKKRRMHKHFRDLLRRAQWALDRTNRINPTGRDIVARVRREKWVEHLQKSIAAAAQKLSPERVRADNEATDIGAAEVELWSRHILNRFPVAEAVDDVPEDPKHTAEILTFRPRPRPKGPN